MLTQDHRIPVYQINVALGFRSPETLRTRLKIEIRILKHNLNMFLNIQGFPHRNIKKRGKLTIVIQSQIFDVVSSLSINIVKRYFFEKVPKI